MRHLTNSIFFVLCLVIPGGCINHREGQTEMVRKVKIEPVQQADSLQVRSFPGIIKEAAEVSLAFRVAGPIQKILVKEGDYVKAGQLVALMDTRDYEVQLQAAQAQYDQVKAEADRVIELHNRESVAGNDYDKAVSGLRMAEAQLKNAKDQLNDTKLTAPVPGYIQKINFLGNELVDAGMPVASMIDVRHCQAEVEIPVSLYVNRDDIVSFSAVQPAVSKEAFPLQLLSYNKKAGSNQLYKVQLLINRTNPTELTPGMDVQINIVSKNSAGTLTCVPISALFNENGKTCVWIYQSDGKVKKRQVITGELTGDGRIRIASGLQVNEQVVVAGVNLLNENEKVESLSPASGTNVGGLL